MCELPWAEEKSYLPRRYNDDQMREYGRARERAAYERAARFMEDNEHMLTCGEYAPAIRALGADK